MTKIVQKILPADFEPNQFTVMCGRGKEYHDSVGNARFRVIVSMYVDRYAQCSCKSEKSQVVRDVVAYVRNAGGQFVKHQNGRWVEQGDRLAREKTGDMFRNALHTRYSSAAKSKAARARKCQPSCNAVCSSFNTASTASTTGSSSMSSSSSSYNLPTTFNNNNSSSSSSGTFVPHTVAFVEHDEDEFTLGDISMCYSTSDVPIESFELLEDLEGDVAITPPAAPASGGLARTVSI